MPFFRKKPVVIEAVQWLGGEDEDIDAIADFMGANLDGAAGLAVVGGQYLEIATLEGTMTADVGDWIIKGIKGEFYPCKPDIFEATYDLVEAE